MTIRRTGMRTARAVITSAVLLMSPLTLRIAGAAAPVGACCFPNGACEELIEFTCDEQNGSFVGVGIACGAADCTAPLAAPLLSLGGVVAVIGALGALGVWRILRRR